MKRLSPVDYYKITEPLAQVSINNLFARAVAEHKISGTVYVDDTKHPETFYIIHPYGMSLLFGKSTNSQFNESFRDYALKKNTLRPATEWMQAFPSDWDRVLKELFGDSMSTVEENANREMKSLVELNTRVNFRFDQHLYETIEEPPLPSGVRIMRTDRQSFLDMPGSVVPRYFWDNADSFEQNGIGFTLFYNDSIAATAYASFILDDMLEFGIETVPAFRGKGFAELVCRKLIDYCIANNMQPVWACRLANTPSYNLAQKLGFVPTAYIPYYKLNDDQ